MVFFLEDDDQLVQAALSFVDECALDQGVKRDVPTPSEGDGVSSTCSSETTSDDQMPIVQSARCKAPVRLTSHEDKVRRRIEINTKTRVLRKAGVYADSNRVRNGRTREIAFLREQMEKLQLDLDTLKQQRGKKASAQEASPPPPKGTGAQPTNPKMWQTVLDIQRRRREEAECENIRLKLIVERQRKVAGNMTNVLQKRATGLVNECSGFIRQNCVQYPIVHAFAFCGDMDDFQELFRHLEAAYQEVDVVFAVNGLVHMVNTPDDVHIREGGDGSYAEAFSNKVLSFGLRDATEATWDHFKGSEKHLGNGNIYEKTARDLDEPYTIVEEFTKELFSRRSHADIKVKQVIRRYVEPDRDIVIWVARVSPAEIKHKMLSGLTYRLRGYAVTKRSSASTPGHEITQLQCCSMISLDQGVETRYTSENLRALSNFLIASTALKMQAHQDRIENALIQQALQRQIIVRVMRQYTPSAAPFLPCAVVIRQSMETDETEAFEAALSFVDEFSLEDAAEAEDLLPLPSQIQNDLVSTDSSHAEEKRRRQREINEKRRLLRKTGVYGDSNRVRNARTREIAFLRGQIEKLQLDLQVLQRRQTSESAKDKKANASALITTNWDSMHIWKEQAVRQRRRREEAESDNVRLRLAVDRQRKVASSLQSLMRKRASQLVNECASLVNTSCPTQSAVDVLAFRGDIGDFHDLFCHLDSAYRNVDAVFAANELTNMAVAPDDVHVREGVEGKYLKFFTYKDLPFRFQDTTEAVWDHFKGVEKHMGYGSLYQKMAKNLDEPYTIIEDFSKEVYSNTSRADVDVKQVVRRYVEADRDIVIWVSHATPAQVKHELLKGLSYNFRGYSITRRSPASTPDNELTQIQLCSLISLDQEEETKYGPDNVRALTNFLIVHAAKNILSHRERIENTLADRALRRTE